MSMKSGFGGKRRNFSRMSFELDNPEVADIIQQYKSGEVGYMDAKETIYRLLFNDIQYKNYTTASLYKMAKKLLLGE